MANAVIVSRFGPARYGLRSILEARFNIVGEASEASELVRLASANNADLVVMEQVAPEETRAINRIVAEQGLALVTIGEDATESARNGYAFLGPDARPDQILAAAEAAVQGLFVQDLSLPSRVLQEVRDEVLSKRELEILQLVAQGLSNKDIADRLSLSLHTIKFHVAAILAKLGVSRRTEAVSEGVRRALVHL